MDELLKRLAAIDAEIEKTLDAADGELTADQQAKYDALEGDRAKVKAAVDREKAKLARAKDRQALEQDAADHAREQAALDERQARTAATPGKSRLTDRDPPTPRTPAERRDAQGRVTGVVEETDETVTLRVGEAGDARRRQSYAQQRRENSRLLKSSGYVPLGRGGEFQTFNEFVRDGFNGAGQHRFDGRVQRHFAAVQGMSEGVGADGGYTVFPEFSTQIIDRLYANDLWGRTDNYTVTGNTMTFLANAETSRATGSRHGGLRGYWLGEGGTVTASKPTLREVSLKLMKLGVVVYLTQELIDDTGVALQEYVARKAAEEFNFLTGDALVNGTGVGQPLGMLNSPSLVSVAKETGQTAATLQTENVTKMFARFFAPNFGNSVWLHNQDILPQLLTMTLGIGAAGVTTYMPPGGLSGAPYGTLLGRPTLPTEFNATLGTQGDLILADLGQMLSISKGGVAQAVSMHVQFLTDQLALRFIIRLNAGPWENSPITPFKGSNTQANFVTLDARA